MEIWIGCFLLMGVSLAQAEDWPAWRGPSANGISAETGWSAESAKVKWTKEVGVGYSSVSVNGGDPLLVPGNKVFISTGYKKGCALLDYSSGKLEKVWENNLIQSHFGSCVLIGREIYGIDGQTKSKGFLRCISVEDGSEKWNTQIGFGSLMVADGKLIVLDEKGTLHFAKTIPDKYVEIAKPGTGLKKLCWTQPVLANGTVYCRNDKGKLVAVDVSK
ncbi:MAG: PQQ-binding-like beta-propeller repeat protein [Lentisphaerae bacterium]|jgi:outer membrane protein assembly factor BamB|nr:PQQ-binding-like beta-propeller repeat protein [Lentisphaerota bacterium]